MTYDKRIQLSDPEFRDNSDIEIVLKHGKQLKDVWNIWAPNFLGWDTYTVTKGRSFEVLPPDFVVRELPGDYDLSDKQSVMGLLSRYGAVGRPGNVYSWEHAAERLEEVRRAGEFWLNWKTGGDVRWVYLDDEGYAPTREGAVQQFVDDLTAGVRNSLPYPVTARVERKYLRDDWHGTVSGDLVDALWTQIHNVVASGLSPRQCANETCPDPRYFVFKRDPGSRGEKHRTKAVKYCSINCGTIQGRRNRNRAKLDQKFAEEWPYMTIPESLRE